MIVFSCCGCVQLPWWYSAAVIVFSCCDCVQEQLDEKSEALEAASRLSEQLDRKEEMIHALREEGNSRVTCRQTLLTTSF